MTATSSGEGLIYPTYYHTFPNSGILALIGFPASPLPFCQNDVYNTSRTAAALAGDTLMLVIPRQSLDDSGKQYAALHYQYNTAGLSAAPAAPTIDIVHSGVVALDIVPPINSSQGYATFYPRIEIMQGVQGVIFGATKIYSEAISVWCFTTLFDGPSAFSKPADCQTAALTLPNGPTTGLIDFTSASINDTIYLFWSNSGDANVYVNPAACSYGASSSSSSSGMQVTMTPGQTTALLQPPEGATLRSMDAAVVNLNTATDGSGATTVKIAVALLYQEAGGQTDTVDVRLYDPTDGSVSPLFAAASPVAGYQSPSVRVAWGSLPFATGTAGQTTQTANGLTVAVTSCAPSNENAYYAMVGAPNVAVVDLTPTSSFGSLSAWTDLTPPLSNYYGEPNVDSKNADIWALAQSTVLLSMPTYADDNSDKGVYQVGLVGLACVFSDNSKWFIESFTAPLPAFSLTLQPGAAQAVNDVAAWPADDIECAITTWQLLGVLAGLPPYPADAPSGATASVSVSYGSSSSAATSQTSSKTLKVGGSLGAFSTSVAYAATQTTGFSQQNSINNTFSFSLTNAVPGASVGWLLFYQPNYILNQSLVTTWGGTNASAGVVFQQLTQAPGNNAGGFAAVEFNIADPSAPINPQDPVQATLAGFAPSVVWPSTTDPAAWTNYYTTESWKLQSLPATSFPSMQVSDNVDTISLQSQSSNTVSADSTLTIEGSAKCQFMNKILGFDVGGSLKTSVSSSLAVASTFTISVTYGGFGPNYTYLLEPQFYMASGPGAPWIPSIVSSQQPWLLTWQIGVEERPAA